MKLWQTVAAGLLLCVVSRPGRAKPPAVPATAPPTLTASVPLPFTATASPAVADVDGDGLAEVAMTVDNIGYGESPLLDPLLDPANPNAVYLWGWRDNTLKTLPGWPRPTRDATMGVSLMDMDRDGRFDVVGACSQDNWPPPGMGVPFVSRLYVWDRAGMPTAPWAPWSILSPNPPNGNTVGVSAGHMYAAPVGFTGTDGRLHILAASQGIYSYWDGYPGPYYPRFGAIRIWYPSGSLEGETSATRPLWTVLPDSAFSRFSLDAPPVVHRSGSTRNIVAATTDGLLYMWTSSGLPRAGWYPNANATTRTDALPDGRRAPIRSPIAAADLSGDGFDEVLAATGDQQTLNAGILYCWNANGYLRWRYPSSGTVASFTSGVAVGRLGASIYPSIVAGDAAGRVTAFDRSGRVAWWFDTAPGAALGQYPVVAQPVIGDVNADGVQDVVVAGTNGTLSALDGRSGKLLWQVLTPSISTPTGLMPEAVLGAPALCDLDNDGSLDVVVVTWQRYYLDGAWYGFGHILAWDCGPRTYRPDRLDWPQFQHDALRTGRQPIFR